MSLTVCFGCNEYTVAASSVPYLGVLRWDVARDALAKCPMYSDLASTDTFTLKLPQEFWYFDIRNHSLWSARALRCGGPVTHGEMARLLRG